MSELIEKAEIEIFLVTHKILNKKIPQNYKVISVGGIEYGDFYDFQGENISYKNKNYSELTALYWIWKNRNCNIAGLVHYRRFFASQQLDSLGNYQPMTLSEISEIVYSGQVILPMPVLMREGVAANWVRNHGIESWFKVRNVFEKIKPDYLQGFDKLIYSNETYLFNMMIMDKKHLDSYCEWLFDILFELEKVIDLTDKNNYQQRFYGFLSERLLNVWLDLNNVSVNEVPVFTDENAYLIESKKSIKSMLRRGYYGLHGFFFNNYLKFKIQLISHFR